jgi:hypothetical protein
MRASPGLVRCRRHEVPRQISAESVNLAFTFNSFSQLICKVFPPIETTFHDR